MLSTTARSLLRMQTLKRLWPRNEVPRRNLSVQAIYSSFPASLLRYSSRPKSSLFDVKDLELRVDDPPEDAVRVSGDGLVYPGVVEGSSLTNGAVFMPNTYAMQEIIRRHFDYYLELEEDSKVVDCPLILRIPKGTPLTNGLVLFHEYAGRFSLQPSRAMPLNEFNGVLDEFYKYNAAKETVEQWLRDHPFESAVPDDQNTKWMSV